jgi:hypothetical protein
MISGVKYKHIPSLLHNFTDSFLSLVNYSEGGYVADAVADYLHGTQGKALEVQWLPEFHLGKSEVPEGLRGSFLRYWQWLPSLGKSMSIDCRRIRHMSTIFSLCGEGLRADTAAADDRGHIFNARPKHWT